MEFKVGDRVERTGVFNSQRSINGQGIIFNVGDKWTVVAIEEVSVIGALFPFVVVEVDGYPNSRMKNIASYLRKVEE
jgi:hypothetical protein